MVLGEFLGEMARDFDEVTLGDRDFDARLAHIELDPSNARCHLELHATPTDQLETAIEAIYVAANAGEQYARFLIYAAAKNSVISADEDADAAPGGWEVTQSVISDCETQLDCNEARNTPIVSPFQSVKELDASLATMELTIENVLNGIFLPEEA